MKIYVPKGNIAIGTLYLAAIIITVYITKLALKIPNARRPKYNAQNIVKALDEPRFHSIPLLWTLVKAFALKYTAIGGVANRRKVYLLKQLFIISVIGLACCGAAEITLWPVALVLPILLVLSLLLQIGLSERSRGRVEEQTLPRQDIIIERVGSPEPAPQGELVKTNSMTKHPRQLIGIGALSILCLIFLSQTMFTLYNSILNLGLYNLASTAIVYAIDQLVLRPTISLVLVILAFNIKRAGQNPLQSRMFIQLCSDVILQKINDVTAQDNSEMNHYEMGASPTKKKQVSPSKVPKAQSLYFQSDTLMNLQDTNRIQDDKQKVDLFKINESQEQIEEKYSMQSPIREISLSQNQSVVLTSAQKRMFLQSGSEQNQNKQDELNSSILVEELVLENKHNAYFSAQRPYKNGGGSQGLNEDGLILLEAGFQGQNRVDESYMVKCSTLDVEFSPSKRARQGYAHKRNKRQLIITGSSPYLQYLPNMMKKGDQKQRKSLTPSLPQIATVSRKVL